MHPEIAAVVATRNRENRLRLAIQSLLAQTLPRDRYEIIIVDNASDDGTSALVRGLQAEAVNLHYVYEARTGLSCARNAGWRRAKAPLVAFLDDDAVAAPDWLERLLAAFSGNPGPACVGGRVTPDYESAPPDWLAGPLLDYLSVVDHSPAPRWLTGIRTGQKLAGVNFAMSAAALAGIGGFSTKLGRVGSQLICGEDVLVQLQCEAAGLGVLYDPSIAVSHFVATERMRPGWLERRAYYGGISDALLVNFERHHTAVRALRTVLWSLRHLALGLPLMLSLLDPNPRRTALRCAAWHRLGFLVGAVRGLQGIRIERTPAVAPARNSTARNG
jgi:glycosyltransferase involved in cell wall biosynthesis